LTHSLLEQTTSPRSRASLTGSFTPQRSYKHVQRSKRSNWQIDCRPARI
jgi:hypothetical protein